MINPDFTPIIMSYGEGITPEEFPEFIKALQLFHENALITYKGQKIKYFLLPQDQVDMLSQLES